jgi:hypothetical protein
MNWHVQYIRGERHHVAQHTTPEHAIEAACGLIDEGCDVYGIGTGPLCDSIARDEIVKIHRFWARARPAGG